MIQKSSPAISSMRFEEALADLESVVRTLEQGSASLEESIAAYKRGVELKKRCEALLDKASSEVEKITQSEDGTLKHKTWQEEEGKARGD